MSRKFIIVLRHRPRKGPIWYLLIFLTESLDACDFLRAILYTGFTEVVKMIAIVNNCEPDSGHVNFMVIRKGTPKRCECGHWFKAIDADPESV
ncbi:hypothetical protein Y032_0120g938 [Ancylostoma ceylanicum]|uniref:Uncharacterized protein n=1 Tax=Ancylostoma ceylanicum TaxID=53326 RepID=A0A016TAU4_9BILA|nr:hypothetical protein Y032_0120g938 [Ancylostoma ceylanicum]